MVKDPKQIITPYAFDVHPDLLGLPLATPKRRLAAILVDLFIAGILSTLGNLVLAIGSSVIFFWIAIRTKNEVLWQNILRYTGAALASILIFGLTLGLFKKYNSDDNNTSQDKIAAIDDNTTNIDWSEFSEKMAATDFTNENDVNALEAYTDRMSEDALKGTHIDPKMVNYDSASLSQFLSFYESTSTTDSAKTDSLRKLIVANIAAPEISDLETRNNIFSERIDNLEDENEDLKEDFENLGISTLFHAALKDLGLTLGWVGVYFILTVALFKGHTPGKKLFSLKIIRLNNKPIGIWYSFERFGGYAAGVATGLLGFFQVFWDPNRQAIHDKIASTVVVDLREKKKKKVKSLKKEVLREENLLEN